MAERRDGLWLVAKLFEDETPNCILLLNRSTTEAAGQKPPPKKKKRLNSFAMFRSRPQPAINRTSDGASPHPSSNRSDGIGPTKSRLILLGVAVYMPPHRISAAAVQTLLKDLTHAQEVWRFDQICQQIFVYGVLSNLARGHCRGYHNSIQIILCQT
jgi:hypothetical protein